MLLCFFNVIKKDYALFFLFSFTVVTNRLFKISKLIDISCNVRTYNTKYVYVIQGNYKVYKLYKTIKIKPIC